MQEKPTLIYIPPNVGGGAKGISIGGMTTVRNIIEALAVFLSSLLLMLFVRMIIHVSVISWIIVFIGLILAFFCIMGVNGEPMSIFFMNVASYNNRRIFVTLRPPMPKEKEKQVFGSSFDQKLQGFMTKSKNPEEDSGDKPKKKSKKEKPEKKEKKKLTKEEKLAAKEARKEEKRSARIAKLEAKQAAKEEKKAKRKAKKEGDSK